MAIHIKKENKGKFTATKKRTGKSTEALTHSKNPLTRKRAIFAQNAKKWAKNRKKYDEGGLIDKPLYVYPYYNDNTFSGAFMDNYEATKRAISNKKAIDDSIYFMDATIKDLQKRLKKSESFKETDNINGGILYRQKQIESSSKKSKMYEDEINKLKKQANSLYFNSYGSGGKIYIKPENRGKFTAWAKAHGKSVSSAAAMILKNKDRYSPALVKRANFARNASKWKHEEGGLVQYDGGGMVSGLGSIMSVIPTPFTQILGAGLGLLGGVMQKNDAEQQQKELERKKIAQQQQTANENIRSQFMPTFYGIGGLTPNGKPVEIEGGEVTQGPDGSLAKFEGPTHEQGGIKARFANNTRVFSDSLINPYTGNTFAKDAEILKKQLDKLNKNK